MTDKRRRDQARSQRRTRAGRFARMDNSASFIRVDDIMRQVADNVTEELAERLIFWAKNIKTNQNRLSDLRQVHSTLAEETRRVVLSEYEQSVENNPAYRYDDPDDGRPNQFKRYSGGAMARALSDLNNYTFSPREFAFIDFELMDSYAKQWYRLNFGTKDRPGTSPKIPNLKFLEVNTGRSVNLSEYQPSDFVSMPKGFWSKTFAASTAGTELKRGRGAFYPATLGPKAGYAKPVPFRRVRGIEGKHFLDQGAKYINKRYPKLLEEMIADWMKRGL